MLENARERSVSAFPTVKRPVSSMTTTSVGKKPVSGNSGRRIMILLPV